MLRASTAAVGKLINQLYVLVVERMEYFYTSHGKGGFKTSVINSSPILSDLINRALDCSTFSIGGCFLQKLMTFTAPNSSQSQLRCLPSVSILFLCYRYIIEYRKASHFFLFWQLLLAQGIECHHNIKFNGLFHISLVLVERRLV